MWSKSILYFEQVFLGWNINKDDKIYWGYFVLRF